MYKLQTSGKVTKKMALWVMPIFRAQTKYFVGRQKVQSAPNMELREAKAFLKYFWSLDERAVTVAAAAVYVL